MPPHDQSVTQPLPINEDTLIKLKDLAECRGASIADTLCHLIDEAAVGHKPTDCAPDLSALTPKQRTVLEYLKFGLSVKETASRMGVSEETVRTHILRIRNRLNCVDLLALRFQ